MHTQAYVLNQQGVTIFRIISASRTFTALRSNGGALDIARARGTVLRSDLWASYLRSLTPRPHGMMI